MAAERELLYFDGGVNDPPALLTEFAATRSLEIVCVSTPDDIFQRSNRGFPVGLVLDARSDAETMLEISSRMKADPFLSIVPVALLVDETSPDLPTRGLESGADEVLRDAAPDREKRLRLDLLLRRADRDVSVHPTTRLPGTSGIRRDLEQRIDEGAPFAFCYADLDHFKEFNDRYGYNRGDRVIFLLSIILRDMVRAMAPGGFVGHIGGDDFTFSVPLEHLEKTCDEILGLFDELIPYQYSEEDRRTGYFLGRDRRGNLHRIPLMTLSVGIVTNKDQEFTHSAEVSELAGDMKSYAKSLPGSVYVVDRRRRARAEASDVEHRTELLIES